MTEEKIRFEDGAGYERMMGVWSRLVGEVFLDWLARFQLGDAMASPFADAIERITHGAHTNAVTGRVPT